MPPRTVPPRTMPLALVAAALAGALVAGRPSARAAEDRPLVAKPVKALRYRITVYDSALDVAHRAGREITELWFPDAGIACNLESGFAQEVAAHAWYTEPRFRGAEVEADRPGLPTGRTADLPTEEIEVPAALFDRVKTLADATRAQHAAATALSKSAATTTPNPFAE